MPLQSFVVSAKAISKQMDSAPVSVSSPAEPKPKGRFIDASDFEKKPSTGSPKQAVSMSTSVTAIRDELAAKKSQNVAATSGAWENCKCLKKSSDRNFCTKFLSLCAKDSCPPKYREF